MAKNSAKRFPVRGNPNFYYRDIERGRVYDFKYRDHTGRTVWSSGFDRLDAAKRERAAILERQRTAPTVAVAPPVLSAFLDEDWLPGLEARVADGTLRASTAYQYRRDAEGYLRPTFGEHRLDWIDVRSIESWQNRLRSRLSAHTIIRLVNTLSGVMAEAKRMRLIASNPCQDVRKPSAKTKRKPPVLTLAQVHALAAAAGSDDDRRLILLAAYTGARQGELFGLRWPNVQLADDAGLLVVCEQVYRGEHSDRPKTASGERAIPLGRVAAQVLREQAAEGRDSADRLVFPAPGGSAWLSSNFNRRVWQPARQAAGLPEAQFHDLRRFHTTQMRAQGLPTVVTEQLLGHADDRTHRGYTQQLPAYEQLVRDAADQAFTATEAAE